MIKIDNISIEERQARAEELFENGYNCCQAVVLAFSDITGLDEDSLKAATSGFGGGFGRLREVCGAVSGMTFLAGFIEPATDPTNRAQRAANYALVQKFAERFREERGSIVCRELLGLRQKHDAPNPEARTAAYYESRPCAELVGCAAEILENYLIKNSKN